MSSAENPEQLPLVVDVERTRVSKDGKRIEYATHESVIESLDVSGIGVLAEADALWGKERGGLAELLTSCPIVHLRQLGRSGLMAQGMGAVSAAQQEFEG